jgi:cytochrome oxidase assembly protein ShyY1
VRLIRLRQTLIVLAGLAVAAVMVVLGLWQLDVYRAQGEDEANRRAALPAVELSSVARAGQPVSDGYGRPVSVQGRYLAEAQVLVPVDGRPAAYRVVTALRLANGDVLPVVRGLTTSVTAPPAPDGQQTGTGLLLPSEEAPTGNLPAGQISSVRLPTLAQTWPGPLVSGFVTLSEADARAQGLAPAPVALPEASGRLRNGAYALQWWVFAGFAVTLAVRMARDQVLRGPEVADLTPEEQAQTT